MKPRLFYPLGIWVLLLVLASCTSENPRNQLAPSSTSSTSASTTATGITSVTTTGVPSSVTPADYFYRAPANIDKSIDRKTVRVNLVKLGGTIPSPLANILVNNTSVTVDSNGKYDIFLDLNKGENIIELKTIAGGESTTETLRVNFVPPLAIRLKIPDFDPNTVFTSPTAIGGVVSNPAAEVKVNGSKVSVGPDGTFTAHVLGVKNNNHVEAVATVGDESDRATLNWILADNGHIVAVPGPTFPPYKLPTVTLKAGESTSFGFSLVFSQGIVAEALNSIIVVRQARLGDFGSTQPMLPNPALNIDLKPSSYRTYPRIQYFSELSIKTAPQLSTGDYYFSLESSLDGGADFTGDYYFSSGTLIGLASSRPGKAYFGVSVK